MTFRTSVTRRPPLALFAILVLVGFLMVITGTATSAANRTAEPRRQAIIDQILDQQKNVDNLDKQVVDARENVAKADAAAGVASAQRGVENREEQSLALAAGTVAVKGSGLVVEVSDAPKKADSTAAFDATRIQDNDLQLLVNALFAAGAEAIAVNDNRIVAVTPIRAAGGTIVVNYRPVNSPYKVVAIGANKDVFKQSEIAGRFSQWKTKYQLGYSVNSGRNLSAPAYSGRVGIDLATAATTTTTTALPSSTGRSSRGVKR